MTNYYDTEVNLIRHFESQQILNYLIQWSMDPITYKV